MGQIIKRESVFNFPSLQDRHRSQQIGALSEHLNEGGLLGPKLLF